MPGYPTSFDIILISIIEPSNGWNLTNFYQMGFLLYTSMYEKSCNLPHLFYILTIINWILNLQLLFNIVFVVFFTAVSFPNLTNMDKQWLCINSVSILMIYRHINILQNSVKICIITYI